MYNPLEESSVDESFSEEKILIEETARNVASNGLTFEDSLKKDVSRYWYGEIVIRNDEFF